MSLLEILSVKKKYENKVAVDIDEIKLESGKVYGYLGRNGAGKSTTINIVMGLQQADQGDVYFEGKRINIGDLEHKKYIGYCPDYPAVFPKLTVYEHFCFIAAIYGIKSDDELNDKIEYYLEHFDLKQYENSLIETLSRGNQQKVTIVASLLHNPKLLVYDEPTLGLDPISLKQFKDAVRKFADDGGTVFLSSHSLNTIEEIADYVIVIEKGKIIRNCVKVENLRDSLVSVEEYLLSAVEGIDFE